ncbi:MAG: hypothetical protein L7S56_05500 [Candidatus Poseidonia sp.]|nr:hypothetical protein [Poseidonia sp.]
MGLEMVALLLDTNVFSHIIKTPWDELKSSMESGVLREIRPEQDSQLKTSFAIDAEAELLDWMDTHGSLGGTPMSEALTTVSDGEEGLLLMMKWASPGAWEVWEGRAFLYLEVAMRTAVDSIHDLYTAPTWVAVSQALTGIAANEFSERVVLDWMERRKALGETLDELEDPKIVPTFEAHDRASKTLVHAVNRVALDDSLVFIIGREHLEATKWGHGDWNLSNYLQSS